MPNVPQPRIVRVVGFVFEAMYSPSAGMRRAAMFKLAWKGHDRAGVVASGEIRLSVYGRLTAEPDESVEVITYAKPAIQIYSISAPRSCGSVGKAFYLDSCLKTYLRCVFKPGILLVTLPVGENIFSRQDSHPYSISKHPAGTCRGCQAISWHLINLSNRFEAIHIAVLTSTVCCGCNNGRPFRGPNQVH